MLSMKTSHHRVQGALISVRHILSTNLRLPQDMKFEQIVNKIIVFNTESKFLQCKFIFHHVVIGGWAPVFT